VTWVDRFRRHERIAFAHHRDLVGALGIWPGMQILDAGCGTGGLAAHLAEAGGVVTGIDQEAEFIASAKELIDPKLVFQTGDITALPFAPDRFDVAWCCNVIRWLAQPELAFREFGRVLRSGGRVVLAEPAINTRFFGPGGPPELRNIEARIEAAQKDKSYWPVQGWRGMLRDAGFTDIRLESRFSEFTPPLNEDQQAWVADRVSRMSEETELTSAEQDQVRALAQHGPEFDFIHVRMGTTLYFGTKP